MKGYTRKRAPRRIDERKRIIVPGKGGLVIPKAIKNKDAEALYSKVAMELLHEHRATFDTLNEVEKRMLLDWLTEAIVDGNVDNMMHRVLWEIDYHSKPVSIERFITDEDYLGKVGRDLHPKWVDDLKMVFAPGSRIFEWIMTGAIGIGKTTLAMLAMSYKIYMMSKLRNPAKYYGLLSESMIIFGIYSITKRQVSDTGYHKLRGYIDSSPYFRQNFPRSPKIDSQIDFEKTTKKKIKVVPGSQELHALGLDLFAFAMDEVNFMREKTDKDKGQITGQAYDLYNSTHSRMISRFIRPGGNLPGLMILMSSRNAQTSFLEQRLKKVKNSDQTHVSDYALWEVKDKAKYTFPGFKVEVGDRVSQSRILKPDEKTRPGVRVVEIPQELYKPFVEDIDQALRDTAGVATFNLNPLIRDRASITDVVKSHMVHPFSKESAWLSTEDDVMLEDYYDISKACVVKGGMWKPRINPMAPRFGHTDIGLTGDCAGLAMGHVSGMVKIERTNFDGTKSVVEYPYVVIDFMIRIIPPAAGEIDLSKLRAFWMYISRLYDLKRVTFDGFQSRDSVQILNKQGLEAGLLSVDRNDEAYLGLRAAHFERRIATYYYEPYIDEMLDLERDAKKCKVDHPTKNSKGGKGSKDVADGVAGVMYALMHDDRATRNASMIDMSEGVRVVSPDGTENTDPSLPKSPSRRVIAGKTYNWEDLRGNLGFGH